MTLTLRIGEASETFDSPNFAKPTQAEYANARRLQEELASYGSSSGQSSDRAFRRPEQIGVAVSGFGIDTRATPIYAGRLSRNL